MLTKFLLTAAVLIAAIVVLQRRRVAARAPEKPAAASTSTDYRLGAWLFLALMLGAAGVIGVQRWQDANREVTVLLHRDGASSPVIYRVNKNALSERSFITIDGVHVTVSVNERMEIVGL